MNEIDCKYQEYSDRFNGPQHYSLSGRMILQDGDMNIPNSLNISAEKSPPQQSQISILQQRRRSLFKNKQSEVASGYEEEQEDLNDGKPQFLKLLIAKSLQTNFINNLWNRTYLKKLHQLSPFQIQILDDLQVENQQIFTERKNFWLNIKNISLFEVFSPYSNFIAFWDVTQISTYLLMFFWMPYKLSFNILYMSEFLGLEQSQMLETLLLITLATDVLVGCNLAFIEKGQLIRNRKQILKYYIKTYISLVSLVTISMQFYIPNLSGGDNSFLVLQIFLGAVFFILRISKINKILAFIQRFFNLNGSLDDILGLFKLIFTSIFIAHICGCIWHGIAFYHAPGGTWIDTSNMRNADNTTRYLASLYWATMTMTTVGYGDFSPQNNSELLCAIVTMFVVSIVFAYSVNSIGIFVQNLYKGNSEYIKMVSIMNNFMQKNQIDSDLQARITSYLEYIWKEEQQRNDEEVSQIMNKLSTHLQDQLQYQLRGTILQNCKIIEKTFSDKMKKALLNTMEEVSYSPEELIINCRNQDDDGAIYIIMKGEVDIVFDSIDGLGDIVRRTAFKTLRQGEYFGEYKFITGMHRIATAVSRAFTKVFKIDRESFIQVLKQFPDDYEKYQVLKYKLMMDEFDSSMMRCYICSSNKHLINKCHIVHYQPDPERIIKKLLFPVIQKRKNFSRDQLAKTPNAKLGMNEKILASEQIRKDIVLQTQSRGETEIEEFGTHSNLINEVYEDSKIELDNFQSSSLHNRSPSRQLTDENQQGSGNPLSQYFRKSNLPKQTVQTAGFGGMKESQHQRDQLIIDNDLDSSEEDSQEQQDQVQITLPSQQVNLQPSNPKQIHRKGSNQSNNEIPTGVQRQQHSKVTLIKHNEDDVLPRQGSLRSRTYTQKKSDFSKQVAQNHDSKQNFSVAVQDPKLRQASRHRTHTKKHSTHTNTKVIDDPTSYVDETQQTQQNRIEGLTGLDKMQIFKLYFPLNNYDLVIKRYDKVQKYFGKRRVYPDSSPYTFYFMNIKKAVKLKKLGDNRNKKFLRTLNPVRTPGKKGFRSVKTTLEFGQLKQLSLLA